MLLAYVDESYTDEYYWIAAVAFVPENEIQPLIDTLDAVVAKASQGYRDISSRANCMATPCSTARMTGNLWR